MRLLRELEASVRELEAEGFKDRKVLGQLKEQVLHQLVLHQLHTWRVGQGRVRQGRLWQGGVRQGGVRQGRVRQGGTLPHAERRLPSP